MAIAKVPVSERDISLDWVRSLFGAGVEELRCERIGEAYGFSSKLYRCRMAGTGVPTSVVVKLFDSERAADLREVPFYSTFATRLGTRIPRSHGGEIEGRHAVLVLEDFEHATQGDCLDQLDAPGAAVMARTLAALHATWWEREELTAAAWLPPMSVRTQEWLLTRRGQYLRTFGSRVPGWVRQLLDRVESISARAVELLADAPQTLLHADLHLDNALFDGGSDQPVILDWARVARGPAAIDLVELLFSLAPAWKPALAVYLEEMRERGIEIDEPALRRQLGGALLRRFISATCGITRPETSSDREQKIMEVDQRRIFEAIEEWRQQDREFLLNQ